MCKPCHINCIVPSHMLEGLLEHRDRRKRAMALETLLLSESSREQRSLFGRLAIPGGGLNRTIYDMENSSSRFSLPGRRMRQEGQSPVEDPAVNEAYDGLGETHRFFREVYGRDSIDGNGMRLDGSVHFGEDYLNAFWNGAQMVFGDGDGGIFLRFTKSLDVIAHELAHGVTEFTAGLEYHKQPGALNESFSDVFGSLVKQYAANQTAEEADWLIGDTIIGPEIDGVALRSMKDPGSAYDDPQLGGKDPQPKHMSDYKNLPDTRPGDWGGVHINSGIPNHAFFLVATRLGGYAWKDAGRIWYDTLLALNRRSDFAHCAATSIAISAQIYGTESDQHYTVREAWRDVGVVSEPAGREAGKRPRSRRRKRSAKVDQTELETSLETLSTALRGVLEVID